MKRYSPNHPAVRHYREQHATDPNNAGIQHRTQQLRKRRGLTATRRIHRNNALLGGSIIVVALGVNNTAIQVATLIIGAAIFLPAYTKVWDQ